MSVAPIKQSIEQKMSKSIEALKTSLGKIRTGRAHAGLLDHITVDYYGSQVPINQVANVTVLDARTIGVQAWEKKMGAAIDKAIRESDLGLNPIAMGELLRVPMPPLSEERRREMAKIARTEAEQGKVAIRNLRRDGNEQLKKLLKDKAISEDDERRAQDDIQKLTDRHIAEVDKLLAGKEQEIMTV
jgi:ribosome recycling factor